MSISRERMTAGCQGDGERALDLGKETDQVEMRLLYNLRQVIRYSKDEVKVMLFLKCMRTFS